MKPAEDTLTYTPENLDTIDSFSLPEPSTSSDAAGFEGSMDAFSKGLETKRKKREEEYLNSREDYTNSIFDTEGEEILRDKLYSKEGGVDDAQEGLDDIEQQMLEEQEGLRRRLENIDDNAEGLETSGVLGRKDEERRKSIRTLADMSIIHLARQRKFDSAKVVADRAVAAQVAQDRQKNEALRLIYEDNKQFFSEADQKAFEVAQKDRERTADNKEYRLRAMYDQMIKQNDPKYLAELALTRSNLAKANAELAELTPTPLAQDQQREYLQRDIGIVESALSNDWGLQVSSGLNQNVFLEGYAGPFSAPWAAARKQDFLSEASYIVKNLTFDKIKELGDKGIKLTPISERELKAMGDASSVLVSAARFDEQGNLTGFNISEDKVRKQLGLIADHYKKAVGDIEVANRLSDDDVAEINSL